MLCVAPVTAWALSMYETIMIAKLLSCSKRKDNVKFGDGITAK